MRFSKFLTDLLPRTGRIIKEDGDAWNEAGAGSFFERYNLLTQTIQNGAVEFGRRTDVLSANSLNPIYYYLDIPVGRRFFIWFRDLELTEGVYTIDLVTVDSVSGGVPAFKTRLSQNGADTVTTQLITNVSVTGTPVVIMEFPPVDTGAGIGSGRAGGAGSVEGVLKSYVGGGDPVLIRVQRTGDAADFTASIFVIAWEEDDDA